MKAIRGAVNFLKDEPQEVYKKNRRAYRRAYKEERVKRGRYCLRRFFND